jgi:uncharacterized protein YbaP (TraB family)
MVYPPAADPDGMPHFPLWRRRFAWALSIAAFFAAFVPAARAEDAPLSPASLVEEVQVISRLPGPALWRVSTPTSQLWIIGLVSPLPKNFAWDNRRLDTALAGARELVTPPGASVGPIEMMALLIDPGHVVHLDRGQTLRPLLPDALRARFEAAARSVGQDPAHYDHWRPVFASMALVFDAEQKAQLNPKGPQRSVVELARRKGVKVRRLAEYNAADMVRSVSRLDTASSNACVAAASSLVERMPTDIPRLGEAWARGDIATVKAVEQADQADACLAAPPVAALRDRLAKDWAADLAKALIQPGKTVVAVDMGSLARKGGLLDQLKAEGLNVIGPAY